MAEGLLGLDSPPDEFVTDFLGQKAPLAFKGQPALPVTGGPAVGASQGPVSAATQAVPVTAGAGGTQVGSIAPDIIALALKGGKKLSDLAGDLFPGAPSAGAMQTPSGQLTVSAPEILRPTQFPENIGGGEIPGPSIPSGVDAGLNLGQYVGPALSSVTGLFNLGQGIAQGDPAQIVGGAENIALAALPLASVPEGAVGPIGSAASLITAIIMDELADPHGSKSAVQDFNYLMGQAVPGELETLKFGAAILPLINDNLSTDQLTQLYQIARAGLKSSELAADPLSRQGKEKAGVAYGNFPGAEEAVQNLSPQAWLATIRLQDMLAKRGITPEQLTPPAGNVYGAPDQQHMLQMTPEQILFEQTAFPYGREGVEQQIPGGTLWLTPAEALGKAGGYGGFTEQSTVPGGYAYSPTTTAALEGLQPGGYEAGLRNYLETLPGFEGSALAGLWATSSDAMAQPNQMGPAATPALPEGDSAAKVTGAEFAEEELAA